LLLSEKIPVAVNCLVVPSAMLGLTGDTSIEMRAAGPPPASKLALPPLQPNAKLNSSEPHKKGSRLVRAFLMAKLHLFLGRHELTSWRK
jgi:hypothetical protein